MKDAWVGNVASLCLKRLFILDYPFIVCLVLVLLGLLL